MNSSMCQEEVSEFLFVLLFHLQDVKPGVVQPRTF